MAEKYSFLLKFLLNLNSHAVFKFEGKIKFIGLTVWLDGARPHLLALFVLPLPENDLGKVKM
jgi:hypothetical protein